MFCAHCEQPVDVRDVEAPCPACGEAVLAEGRWLLLSRWGDRFEALDLDAGVRSVWPPAEPALAEPDGEELEALFDAVFHEVPAVRAPEVAEPDVVQLRPPLARRVVRRLAVVGASVVLAAQLGFATATPPMDYSRQRQATEGREHLIDAVLADEGVRRCLAGHRALPRGQAVAPALLQITGDPWTPHRAKVTSTNPVLTGCLMRAASRLPLPSGRYHLDVPITEGP